MEAWKCQDCWTWAMDKEIHYIILCTLLYKIPIIKLAFKQKIFTGNNFFIKRKKATHK